MQNVRLWRAWDNKPDNMALPPNGSRPSTEYFITLDIPVIRVRHYDGGNETTDFAFLENKDFVCVSQNNETQRADDQYDEKLLGLTRRSR